MIVRRANAATSAKAARMGAYAALASDMAASPVLKTWIGHGIGLQAPNQHTVHMDATKSMGHGSRGGQHETETYVRRGQNQDDAKTTRQTQPGPTSCSSGRRCTSALR